ncbi:MAG: class I SAM-dependent methyltransferase [Halioglobus sp.]
MKRVEPVELMAVAATDAEFRDKATNLAQRLALPLLRVGTLARTLDSHEVVLYCGAGGLYLQRTGKSAPGPVAVEFGSAAMRHRRRGGQNELLGKAVGVGKKSPLHVLDGTAGLGKDSFVLADLGCEVLLRERNPLIAELLASGLEVASASADSWLLDVITRLTLSAGDVRNVTGSQLDMIDTVYLDPMFPARGKSASVKKEMALFQALLESDAEPADGDQLLSWALEQDVARVVVKRPASAPALIGQKPSHVIAGKAVRYDVYVKRGFS